MAAAAAETPQQLPRFQIGNPDAVFGTETPPGGYVGQWVLDKIAELFHDIGISLLQMAPDIFIMFAMFACLGVIMNVKNAGKFTVGACIAAIVAEVIRKGLGV
ncbi:TPA: hypothetical protein QCN93_005090 [Bacillus pacificus]|nr:hypothetical protein [Bacillus pacificus]